MAPKHWLVARGWSRHFLCLLFVILCVLSAPRVRADQPVPLAQALGVIESLEGRIRNAEWKVDNRRGRAKDSSDLRSIEFGPEFEKGWVVFEPISGRYRLDLESVLAWSGGLAPYIGVREIYTYDGENAREFKRDAPGEKLPGPGGHPGRGHIQKGTTDSAMKWGRSAGTGYFPPYFNSIKLSEFLRTKQAAKDTVQIMEDKHGIWHITCKDPDIPAPGRGIMQIDYDPGKGGVVVGARRSDPESSAEWHRTQIELQKIQNEFWIPKAVHCVRLLDKVVDRIVYSDVKINQPIQQSVFTQEFPIGAVVTDHVQKTIYKAGAKITDEQAAIKSYMKAQGLYPGRDASVRFWVYVMVGFGLAVAAILGWLVVRRRRSGPSAKTTAALLIGAVVVFGFPTDSSAQAPTGTTSESPPMLQCGFNVTVFALEYFGVPSYSAPLTAAALEATREGISLARIQTVLEAHGLKVEARQKVKLADMPSGLRRGALAITAVRRGTKETPYHHYLIVMRHVERGPVVVDVLAAVRPLDKVIAETNEDSQTGMVLFVQSSNKDATNQARERSPLKISPEKMDLGSFALRGPEASLPWKQKFAVENTSKLPVMVTRVASSCGCVTAIDWKGGILNPGERREVKFAVVRAAWGLGGPETRHITLSFADGHEQEMAISGNAVKSKDAHRPIQISCTALRIDWARLSQGKNVLEKSAAVGFDNGADSIEVRSDVPWLAGEVKRSSERDGFVNVHIIKASNLLLENREVQGALRISSAKDQPGATIKVTLFRNDFFQIRPAALELVGMPAQRKELVVEPIAPIARRLACKKAWSDPAGITVEFEQRANSVRLVVGREKAAAAGIYLVKMLLESEQEQAIGTVLVTAKD